MVVFLVAYMCFLLLTLLCCCKEIFTVADMFLLLQKSFTGATFVVAMQVLLLQHLTTVQ